MIKKWLIALSTWIIKRYGITSILITDDIELIASEAKSLCAVEDAVHSSLSGEYKRHQVYARLIRLFPKLSRRDISIGLELGLRRVSDG
jgi:hypothetical protein